MGKKSAQRGDFDLKGLGAAVKRKRRADDVSLRDLREILGGIGISTIARIERGCGTVAPDPHVYCAILRWLGLPTGSFIPGLAPSPAQTDAESAIDMLPALIRSDRNLAADHAEFLVGLLGDAYRRATQTAGAE